MSYKLPTDCLNEIFEHLKDDKISLHSCLLVNRLWCEVTVRILWRDVWSFYTYRHSQQLVILGTLITCLPSESKDFLQLNKIFIPTPTSKPPLFNYISFIKILTFYKIDKIIENGLNHQVYMS